MKTLRIKIISTLLPLILSSAAFAQRSAQILYFKAPKDAPEQAFIYQQGTDPVAVELPRNNFSKSFPLSSGDLVLGFLPGELAEGDEFPKDAPSAKIPASWSKVLILAFADPSNPILPVSFKVVNANPGTFGSGDRMFINFTDSDVFGLVGKAKLTLKANSTEIVKNAASPMEEYQVQLDRIDPASKERLTFIRQIWRQSATRRSIVFIYSPPGTNAITYYNAPVRNL